MTESRYDRQQRFAPVGANGQQRIERARILVIGVGALGSVIAELLCRAGVGFLRIVDRDTVEWSNLQRQSLFTEMDAKAGLAKVHAAATRLSEINSLVKIDPIAADVTAANIESMARDTDLLIDGTDNFEIRFLINDLAWETNRPWIHGGCIGASGQVFAFRPGHTICFRCLIPNPPDPASVPTCDTAGVLGPATHTIASLQALEAIKLIVGSSDSGSSDSGPAITGPAITGPAINASLPEHQQLLSVDLWNGRYRSINTANLKNPACPCCGLGQRDFLSGNQVSASPVVLCGRNAVQLPPSPNAAPIPLDRVATSWQGLGQVSENRFLVRLTLPDQRSITLFRDGRAVIGGTEDPMVARALFAKFIGN